jgi:hypothetical protein
VPRQDGAFCQKDQLLVSRSLASIHRICERGLSFLCTQGGLGLMYDLFFYVQQIAIVRADAVYALI